MGPTYGPIGKTGRGADAVMTNQAVPDTQIGELYVVGIVPMVVK